MRDHPSPAFASYDQWCATFRWQIPERYNMAHHACDGWAARDPKRPALLVKGPDGFMPVSYETLAAKSNALARTLAARGIGRGDRVGILAPQCPEVLISHFALYKLGAVAVPLAAVFGPEAIAFRLADSGAKGLITHADGLARLDPDPTRLPHLTLRICLDGSAPGVEDFNRLIATQTSSPLPVNTGPDDPALMIYTSGTTGQPKGALHAHRVLIPHVTGQFFTHDGLPRRDDRMWTPSDWAWAGGLLNTVLPALAHGVPVVVQPPGRFDPEAAFALLAQAQVRNVFIPPTALKMMRAVARPRERFGFCLRTVGSAGEALGAQAAAWGREALGVPVNEFYGQTECNYVIGSSAALGITRPGATGKAVPGHVVAVLDTDGTPVAVGEMGQIAVRTPDPALFLGYWNQKQATKDKFLGDWMLTGDLARQDEEGYIHFLGRNDDVITSAGYRIGPSEIEDCLLRHPDVALAAVVGKPDPIRTEIVKAFIVLNPGATPGPALVRALQNLVRDTLAGYEYPREISFVEELPLTSTGKVIRRILRDQTLQDTPSP